MRVLWIKSDFPLPTDTGGKIRTKNLLFELARTAEVTFLSYAPPDLENRCIHEMRTAGIKAEVVRLAEERKQGLGFLLRVAGKLLSPRPYVVNKYISSEMAERIMLLASSGDFDVVVCDFLEMAWCADLLGDVPKVLFEHNVESMIWRRHYQVARNPVKKLYLWYEKRRVANFERRACSRFDLVLTVSDQDGETLKRDFGVSRYLSVPTGVDVEYFQPQDREVEMHLVLSGSMDWMPNIDAFWWFYRDILPKIRAELPAVTLTVVGRRPTEEIVAESSRCEGLEVTGTVPDVRPYMAAGALFLVPLRVGGGTRIKIYEALAMRKCVVSTSVGAEGLPLTADEHLIIADSEAEFAKKVTELLRDDSKRDRIAGAGYRLVKEKYSWHAAAETLSKGLQSVIGAAAGRDVQQSNPGV